MSRREKLLKTFRENGSFKTFYNQGMSSLFQSGIFEFLRIQAEPRITKGGSDIYANSHEASRAAGYQEALNDLFEFEDRHLLVEEMPTMPSMDFSGLEKALADGDISKDEYDAIRNNTGPIDYSSLVKKPSGTGI